MFASVVKKGSFQNIQRSDKNRFGFNNVLLKPKMISSLVSKKQSILLLCCVVCLARSHIPISPTEATPQLRRTIYNSITSASSPISSRTSHRQLFTKLSSSPSFPRLFPSTLVCHVLPSSKDGTNKPVMAQTIQTTWILAQTVFRLWYRDPLGQCTIDHCASFCASLSSTETSTLSLNDTESPFLLCPFLSTSASTITSEPFTTCTFIAPGRSDSSVEPNIPGGASSPCSEMPNQVLDDQCQCTCRDGFALNSTGFCVLKCANPYGNPCGPGSACHDEDDAVGYSCTPLYDDEIVCPVGCPPTEYCDRGTCRCKPGHVRNLPYLPCVPVET
jgi:hypothetical protein